MSRVIIAGFVGAVLLFLWGFAAWMLLDLHGNTIHNLPNEDRLAPILQESIAERGVYWFPGFPDELHDGALSDEDREVIFEQWKDKHRAGPVGMLFIMPDGAEPMPATTYVGGFAINLVVALLAAFMLSAVSGSLSGYIGRVLYVIGFGLIISAFTHGTFWNWMSYPTDYTMMMIADTLIAWALLGIVLAAFIRPRAKSVEAAE